MRQDARLADFPAIFIKYCNDWRELERQYYRIPGWRLIKQMQNIRKREHLTRVFTAQMKHRGIIE